MEKINDLLNQKPSRRNFLAGAGAIGAAALVTGCSSTAPVTMSTPVPGTPTTGTTTTPLGDNDYLNFALNLEYLEAEFYLRAATGTGLSAADVTGTGTAGAVTGGSQIPGLTPVQAQYINEIAFDEQQHVKFLRSALGSAAVARPAIDFATAFNTLASAAGIGATFNPFADYNSFLVGAFVFEDVGVTAYHGAAGLISTAGITGGLLAAAAGILAVEAYHAAVVRTQLTGLAITAAAASPAVSYPYLGYANKVSALRGTLGGGNETPLVLPTSVSTPSSIVAADTTNAIAFARTTDQVLHIVYGSLSNTSGATTSAAGVSKGVFFPAGLNGNISVTTS